MFFAPSKMIRGDNVKLAIRVFQPGVALCLMLLCSCVTSDSIRPTLPPETPINSGAGRGDAPLLTVRMGSGQELSLGVDTGAPYTLLDKSLEPTLGQRLGRMTTHFPGGKAVGGLYRAPQLWLGNVRLLTGRWVATTDMSSVGYPGPLQGILGMDCLRHYCIQLDFMAGRWRFLDPENLAPDDLGQPFLLTRPGGCFAARENLVGVKGQGSLIDTGCNFDGLLTPQLFRKWTNHWESPSCELSGCAVFPNGQFGGATYTNLDLHIYPGNVVGLRFLARNLVTLNFPKQTMYLKQRSVGPLAEDTRFFEKFHTNDLRRH